MIRKMKIGLKAALLGLLIAGCVLAVGCKGGQTTADTSTDAEGEKNTAYVIEVKTEGGMSLSGVDVYIYEDDTLTEMVAFAKTDAEGKMSFTDVESETYVAVLQGVNDGYQVEKSYALSGAETEVVLSSEVLPETDLSGVSYKLGSVIHDFTLKTPDNKEYKLSDLLKEKKAVILNFWYTQCEPCKMEFPYLQEAYEKYSKEVEVLAINPVEADDDVIAGFQKSMGLIFPVAQGDANWQTVFNLVYPTTVVVDRYGVITLIHKGTLPNTEIFENVFECFTAEDYVQTLYKDMSSFEGRTDASTEEEEETTSEQENTEGMTQDSTEESTQESIEAPTKESTEAPTKESIEAPAKESTEAPTKESTEASTQGNTDKPTEEPTEAPITSNIDNPIETGGQSQLVIEIGANEEVYYNIYRLAGMVVTINDPEAYVILHGEKIYPTNGRISFVVADENANNWTPTLIGFGHEADSKKTITALITHQPGSFNNPYAMKLNEIVATNIPEGNESGIYYSYTATTAGTLTIELVGITPDVKYNLVLYNLTTYKQVALSDSAEGSESVSLPVNAGDVVSISIGTLPDDGWNYPAATVQTKIFFQ